MQQKIFYPPFITNETECFCKWVCSMDSKWWNVSPVIAKEDYSKVVLASYTRP